MDFYGYHFEYAGELSRKYGLIIANVTTDRNTLIAGKSKTVSTYNKRNFTKYHIGTIYSDAPLTFEMEVVVTGEPIYGEWRRKIQKWLFNQKDYQKLYIDKADECTGEAFDLIDGLHRRMYLNCRFVNPEIIEGNGGIVGYRFEVECDSHMAKQDPTKKSFSFSGGLSTIQHINVLVDTDHNDYIYPKVTIRVGRFGGNIDIINHLDSDDRLTSFVELPANTTLVLNGSVNYVSDTFYEEFVDRNFPRLLDGNNAISIIGDVLSIEFEWQNMRYL